MNPRPTLIIPVESQVREMDAKLLFSCVAAERGYSVIMGSRTYVHFQITSMPPGTYVAKSMRAMSDTMFRIIRHLGHKIVAWEEEALVHPPTDIFFSLRLSPATISQVSRLFAWGRENADLMSQYPHLPEGMPIDITGNPRGDMLRAEIQPYFDETVQALRSKYGSFLLLNTNFTDVNPFLPNLGLFVPSGNIDTNGKAVRRFGQAGRGMTLEFAEGLYTHKQRILRGILELIPVLEKAFPQHKIIVRPHPSEDHSVYHEIAGSCSRVVVTHEGNVLPWILASSVLLHNGCTTAAEAFALGVPAVSYLPVVDERFDYDFQGMPNRLSYRCHDIEELQITVGHILAGKLGPPRGDENDTLMDYYLTARNGPLACDRILQVLDDNGFRDPTASPGFSFVRQKAWLMANTKTLLTKLYMHRPGPNRRDYHDHRFPLISAESVQQKIDRFSRLLGRFAHIRATQFGQHTFRIETTAS